MRDSPAPIRVLQLVPTHSLGGAMFLAMVLAERLDSTRYQVMLAVGQHSGPEGSLLEEARQQGIEVAVLPSLCRGPQPWKDIRAVLELRGLLHRFRPHIIHTHGSKTKQLLPWATRMAPVPVKIAHIHGWEWDPAGTALTRRLFAAVSRMSAASYDRLLIDSEALRREGLQRGVGRAEQYEVIWPPVDLEAFNPTDRDHVRQTVRRQLGLPLDAFVVISVMRLAPQKAPLDLIKTAEIVLSKRQDARFVVVGSGSLEQKVRHQVEAQGRGKHVLLLGMRRDVPRLLKAADLFALASLWESLGIVYLEASAVGLPCVGTNVGGVAEAIEDGVTGILVPASQPEAMAEAILRIANDSPLAERLARAAQQKAKSFGSQRFVEQVDNLYGRLLAQNGIEAACS